MIWTSLDTWIVIIGALSAMSCALLGNFLLLRGMSMMGDAISHAVLPGLAAAFLITGSRGSVTMFIGALLIGVLTAFLIQLVSKSGQVDESASMGVVFTALFALGLILIRQAADQVDLDPGCVLYGAVELAPFHTVSLPFGFNVPHAALSNGFILLLNSVFVLVLYKELKLTSFDSALADSLGFRSNLMHYLLMGFVAATTVASFQVVGSILVIAMLIVPPAAAFLLTRNYGMMLILSLLIAAASAVLGHIGAVVGPQMIGFNGDTSTAGMIAVASGALFTGAWLFSPSQGLLSQTLRKLHISFHITRDDLLAAVYRFQETHKGPVPHQALSGIIQSAPLLSRLALLELKSQKRLVVEQLAPGAHYSLSPEGGKLARRIVRSHRLWEGYLVEEIGLRPDHVHNTAERLEHYTSTEMRSELAGQLGDPNKDPHAKAIPDED
ncbi:MAG: metal ABC transporter permease [Sumerlaeia bacterium]